MAFGLLRNVRMGITALFVAMIGTLVLIGASTLAAPARADSYVLDREHTDVRFSWDHLGMSRQSGTFRDVIGRVEFDPAQPEASSVNVTIKVASIQTGAASLDRHLTQTTDFFDIGRHPDITFESTRVAMTSARTANVEGDLTINGITKPAILSVVWNFTGEHPLSNVNPVYKGVYASGFSARTQILRSEWGITRTVPLVSDEIRITIEAEMLRR